MTGEVDMRLKALQLRPERLCIGLRRLIHEQLRSNSTGLSADTLSCPFTIPASSLDHAVNASRWRLYQS